MIKPYCCFRNHVLLYRLVVLAEHWIMQLRFFPPLRGKQHLNSSSLSLSYQSPSVFLHISLHNGILCLFILYDENCKHRALALSCPSVVTVCGHRQLREGLEYGNDLSPDAFVLFSVAGSEAAAGAPFKPCCCVASSHSQLGPGQWRC